MDKTRFRSVGREKYGFRGRGGSRDSRRRFDSTRTGLGKNIRACAGGCIRAGSRRRRLFCRGRGASVYKPNYSTQQYQRYVYPDKHFHWDNVPRETGGIRRGSDRVQSDILSLGTVGS